MADLDNPTTCLMPRVAPLGPSFLPPSYDVGDVAVPLNRALQLSAVVARVGTQVLAAAMLGQGSLDHNFAQQLIKSLAVMHVGPGHDDRQRDATPVDQQVALAPLFFPDPSGSVRRLPEQAGL